MKHSSLLKHRPWNQKRFEFDEKLYLTHLLLQDNLYFIRYWLFIMVCGNNKDLKERERIILCP